LCFAQASEKYHHWHVFAQGPTGVCISFIRDNFIENLTSIPGIKHRSVTYKMLKDYQNNIDNINIDDLPFIKRHGFRDEDEFRVIYEDINHQCETKDIFMPLTTIDRIEFNPWIPSSLYESTKDVLHSIEGVEGIKMSRSGLLDNKQWKELANKIK